MLRTMPPNMRSWGPWLPITPPSWMAHSDYRNNTLPVPYFTSIVIRATLSITPRKRIAENLVNAIVIPCFMCTVQVPLPSSHTWCGVPMCSTLHCILDHLHLLANPLAPPPPSLLHTSFSAAIQPHNNRPWQVSTNSLQRPRSQAECQTVVNETLTCFYVIHCFGVVCDDS